MKHLARHPRRVLQDRRGATSIEYAMIAAFVGILIISSLSAMGPTLKGNFNDVLSGSNGVTP